MRAQLIPAEGRAPIELVKDLSIVGRKDDSDVRVDHKSVSKQHCVLVKSEGMLVVRDLGSTNGTRVNGQRVRRAALLPNDLIGFASIRYKVHFGSGPPASGPGDRTVQMSAKESHAGDMPGDSPGQIAVDSVKANQLPDVYPDEPKPADH